MNKKEIGVNDSNKEDRVRLTRLMIVTGMKRDTMREHIKAEQKGGIQQSTRTKKRNNYDDKREEKRNQ